MGTQPMAAARAKGSQAATEAMPGTLCSLEEEEDSQWRVRGPGTRRLHLAGSIFNTAFHQWAGQQLGLCGGQQLIMPGPGQFPAAAGLGLYWSRGDILARVGDLIPGKL